MTLWITQEQAADVKRLARSSCCNCVEGNCLLLSDSEESECVQLISEYGIYCKYFRRCVLPGSEELYKEIMQQNRKRRNFE